jgi:hypothetical protein
MREHSDACLPILKHPQGQEQAQFKHGALGDAAIAPCALQQHTGRRAPRIGATAGLRYSFPRGQT